MLLSVLADNSIPFSLTPRLIELNKEMVRDFKALNGLLSMDWTSASYKMKHGRFATMEGDTLRILRSTHFSLIMDELTSNKGLIVAGKSCHPLVPRK